MNLNPVALIPDDSDIMKLSLFLRSYSSRISNFGDIDDNELTGAIIDVNNHLQPELFVWLKTKGLKTFALDWYAETDDIIKASINLLDGASMFKYCIVRKEFLEAYKKYAGHLPKYDIVIVMGGGDFRGYVQILFDIFANENLFLNKNIAIVIGPLVNDSVLDLINNKDNISIIRNPENIAELMANTSVGISNGGSALIEFTMLGIPTLIFPQTEQEDVFVIPFVEHGCGILGSTDRQKFTEQIYNLWEDKALRTKMSENARNLIDGFGAERIANEIDGFFQESV